MQDCKIRYRGTKLAITKELQQELINFENFAKNSRNRVFELISGNFAFVPRQLVFDG